jgi:hypothetical protein
MNCLGKLDFSAALLSSNRLFLWPTNSSYFDRNGSPVSDKNRRAKRSCSS